jgi:hypothetical protein
MSKKKDSYIFSGANSKRLWEDINNIEDVKIHRALYHLGCKCQELEALVLKDKVRHIDTKA